MLINKMTSISISDMLKVHQMHKKHFEFESHLKEVNIDQPIVKTLIKNQKTGLSQHILLLILIH